MQNIITRKMKDDEIGTAVDIWYEASVKAHDFISEDYWKESKDLMKSKYLPMSEVFVAEQEGEILGFIALVDLYLAAIFVNVERQGQGIGTKLLNHAKGIRNELQLKVYEKNEDSIAFYKSKGFHTISKSVDNETGESECMMEWKK